MKTALRAMVTFGAIMLLVGVSGPVEFASATSQLGAGVRRSGHVAATGWHIIASPNSTIYPYSELWDVALDAKNSAIAVGEGHASIGQAALAEHWDGSRWSVTSLPTGIAYLYGVTCVGPKNCFAVGDKMAHWNGSQWKIQAVSNGALSRVACFTSSFCVAVGFVGTSAPHPLIEQWSGGRWFTVRSANPAGAVREANLTDVTCLSRTNCHAIGTYETRTGGGTFIEHWNGSRWAIAAIPPSLSQATVTAITCLSRPTCFAVGSSNRGVPMAFRSTGGHWAPLTAPTPKDAPTGSFSAINCISVARCLAVGEVDTRTLQKKQVIERWNGATWSISSVPSPPGANYVNLVAVACGHSTNACTAVGWWSSPTPGVLPTLIESGPA